jgi:hypothetical protein
MHASYIPVGRALALAKMDGKSYADGGCYPNCANGECRVAMTCQTNVVATAAGQSGLSTKHRERNWTALD